MNRVSLLLVVVVGGCQEPGNPRPFEERQARVASLRDSLVARYAATPEAPPVAYNSTTFDLQQAWVDPQATIVVRATVTDVVRLDDGRFLATIDDQLSFVHYRAWTRSEELARSVADAARQTYQTGFAVVQVESVDRMRFVLEGSVEEHEGLAVGEIDIGSPGPFVVAGELRQWRTIP